MMKTTISVIFRIVLMLAGLAFVASLLVAALLLLAVWLLRALWARLTGQPVSPWAFQIKRHAGWSRFYRAPEQGSTAKHDDSNVIDVEPKEIKSPF